MATRAATAMVAEGQTLEARLSARLDTLKENRERFIQDAQRQLAALDAAIAEISALLDPPSPNGRESADNADAT